MNICAKHAIVMEEDEQGFLYPKVDEDLCVDCHLCEKVCPFIHQKQSEAPAMVCAAKNKDDKIRKLSSSSKRKMVWCR